VVTDTRFPRCGAASPYVVRQYPVRWGKFGKCQVGVSVHLVNERASCEADWLLFCRNSEMASRWRTGRRSRGGAAPERAGIPGHVRHTEKWRLALEMIKEMTGPGRMGRPE
jgi:SRSO17 transposase